METLTVRIERMAPEGSGIGRVQGRVVFVPFAAAGDLLEVEVTAAKPTYLRARILRVLEPGPGRVMPRCPLHFDPSRSGPACGGCDWQHLDGERQLQAKRDIVADALKRIAKTGLAPVEPVLPSPRAWTYRNKVQVPFGRAPDPGAPALAGFYSAGSHRIVPLEECPVQTDLSVRILRRVRDLAAGLGWRPYEEDTGRGWLRHLFIRTNSEGQALVAIVTRDESLPRGSEFVREARSSFPQVVGLYQNVQPLRTSVILGPVWKRLWGSRGLKERVGRLRFICSPGSFLQVNSEAAALLYDQALAALTEGGRAFPLAFDVYCGVGAISLWIAGRTGRVVGIEGSRTAVQDAILNARANGVRNVRFLAGRAEGLLAKAIREAAGPAAAVVDPPRGGLTPPVLRGLTARAIERVVYVSCDPATFARDAGYLGRSGLRLRRVQPLDLFPQTSHVEIVALLDRT
ncbi:MAG: 23S rRNA (uracil(1939)-C(5))-methyltransferase RlmD [Elusimicrobia bacterium]|nr:23S rRNA (uracil(1939)-C(5))-methyltransferase RlmD [Elusimicrobiota bacterium]